MKDEVTEILVLAQRTRYNIASKSFVMVRSFAPVDSRRGP